MNLPNSPEIKQYEDQAIDTVVAVINRAKEDLGLRPTLRQLAGTRKLLAAKHNVSLSSISSPFSKNGLTFIAETIEKRWYLTPILKYFLKYQGMSQDECSQYYYFEGVFSQPCNSYPIPQATVSVFFRIQDTHIEPPKLKGAPLMIFRIEGQHTNHDVRFVALTADWVLAVIKMKIKLFERIEGFRLF